MPEPTTALRPDAEVRKATSLRLTREADRLVAALAARLGLSRSAVIELAVRRLAEREGVREAVPPA